MGPTVLYNMLVLVGIVAGQFVAPGPAGTFAGAVAGMAAAALLYERFGPVRRSTDGFWLRHRGEFLAGTAGIIGLLAAPQKLPTWPLWLAIAGGWFGGFTLGYWLAGQLGWSGEGHAADLEARGSYVAVLAAAARADGSVSEKERAVVRAAAKRVMADAGYGEACDADHALAQAESSPCSPHEAAAYASQLPPPLQQVLVADLLSVLYSGCRGAGGLPSDNERWLDAFRQAAQVADWSLLGVYDRRYAKDGGACGSRAQWLAELDLPEGATDEDVRAAYRRKAAEYHPDRHQGLAPQIRSLTEAKLAALTEAYRRLLERDGGGGGGGGPLFFQHTETDAGFVRPGGEALTCRCWICGRKNRLPGQAEPSSARCGTCHALLAIGTLPQSAAAATENVAAAGSTAR